MTRYILAALTAALTVALLAGALVGCSSVQVSHDYDTNRDFSKLKTYAWVPRPAARDPETLDEQRIHTAVDAALQAKGYVLTESTPDFRTAFHVATKQKIDVKDWGYGGGPYDRRWGRSNVEVTEYEEGTLVIDVVDPKTNNMMWRGTARARLNRKPPPPAERARRIAAAVDKILATFPPQ